MIYISVFASCFLLFSSCVDYMSLDDNWSANIMANLPPIINTKIISPLPSRLIDSISVGSNCKGQAFMIPQIDDYNTQDRLYFTWFLDNKLIAPESHIEPENRASAVIRLDINEQFLLAHFNGKMPKDFFNKPHILEFDVLDVPYTIPEIRYLKNFEHNEKKHADYAYWIIFFSNEACY